MESLLENLSSFEVTHHPNNPNAKHPRFSLYKAKNQNSCQEQRRKSILEARKGSRYDLLKHLREIDEGKDGQTDALSDDLMETEKLQKIYAKPRKFNDFVLQSEWLVDVPDNLAETYFAMPCPIGKRCLVVTSRGHMVVYAKNGYAIKKSQCLLPGGSPHAKKRGSTILDCIFCESKRIFYILDMVCWNNRSYLDCDTIFRFSWLKVTLSEYEEDVSKISKLNNYKFLPLPFFSSDKMSLEIMLQEHCNFDLGIDGILFYHKDTHYTHGPSPLVCWLKVFMLPEILNVPLPEKFLEMRPFNYTNITDHIKQYEESRLNLIENRVKKKNERRKQKKDQMMWSNDMVESTKGAEHEFSIGTWNDDSSNGSEVQISKESQAISKEAME